MYLNKGIWDENVNRWNKKAFFIMKMMMLLQILEIEYKIFFATEISVIIPTRGTKGREWADIRIIPCIYNKISR